MSDRESNRVENLLARPEVHQEWARAYRTHDNEAFFELAFDRVAEMLEAPAGATVVDLGCGSCAHSVRLARRGYRVHAVDFSESALRMAAEHIERCGTADRIDLRRENLLALSFPDASIRYAVCWGVLMHVPDVERAVSELARVLEPGGVLVLSEANESSIEAVGVRWAKRLFRRTAGGMKRTPAGTEHWTVRGDEALVTRHANIRWLIQAFETRGVRLFARRAGQFSEAYTRLGAGRLRRLIHRWNELWFERVRIPQPAFGNVLFFRKART